MSDEANPKDAAGRAKLPLHLWPATATAYGSIGFLEGELKYGRNNFRAAPVAASVYVAAAKRHLDDWFEGNDNASDTGSPHLGNALACIAIIVDAHVNGSLIDDRNFVPSSGDGAYARMARQLTDQSVRLKIMFADKSPKHWDKRDAGVVVSSGDSAEYDAAAKEIAARADEVRRSRPGAFIGLTGPVDPLRPLKFGAFGTPR